MNFILSSSCFWVELELKSRRNFRCLEAVEEKFIEVFININEFHIFGTYICVLTSKFHKLIHTENERAGKFVHSEWCSWRLRANSKFWRLQRQIQSSIISDIHQTDVYSLKHVWWKLVFDFNGFMLIRTSNCKIN